MAGNRKISRRKFIGTTSCAAIGSSTFFSTLFNLGMFNETAARNAKQIGGTGDYKALVCILLAGGNDSFNMLIPDDDATYAEYAASRSNLALARSSILGLTPQNVNDPALAVHPAMPEVQNLFNSGRLAFISNVGTLIEPITKAQFIDESVPVPLGLLSHADQIQQWQTSIPHERSAYGWGGKMADILHSMNTNQNISMNISLSGRNVFQSGYNTSEYTIKSSGTGSTGIQGYGGISTYDQIRTAAVDSLLDHQYQDIFKQTYADITWGAQEAHEQFSEAISNVELNTEFSANYVSESLQMMAKTIASRDELEMSRQTFFLLVGGWDHHDEVLLNQNAKLATLSKALNEFNSAMNELGISDDVTTFTISDFGRTLTSNGNGTDHAWGGNVMVMGGSVNGGQTYGTYPSLALGSSLDLSRGILIPTTSVDEYFAELARWFGVSDADLLSIFPNLINFYVPGPNQPLGFMQT